MANHFSALKRARQTETRTVRNRGAKSQLRNTLRRLREALASGNQQNAQTSFREAVSVIDTSTRKGVLHKNTANRYKARLNARLNALATK
jgi:small subunit ribosomal protein S20